MFQLFDNPASPYCRKVRVLLHETGQAGDVETIFSVGHPLDTDRMPLDHNPLGKIPCLLKADGAALYDSRVICRFLDLRAGAGLYPESALWEILTLEATADGIMDAAVLMIYEGRARPEPIRYPDWVEAQWSKIERALDTANTRWPGLLGGDLNIGQIALACALGYLDFRLAELDWRSGRAALADWFAEFARRKSMIATAPTP